MGKQSDVDTVETVYFLVLSGGAFRGALQYWVISHLLAQNTYQAIYGVSVGSINGVMAAMDKMDELLVFWNVTDGKSGFLRLRLFYAFGWLLGVVWLLKKLGVRIIGGLYSMAPLVAKLRGYVKLADIKTPFVAGVVAANSGKYHELDTREMKTDERVILAIQSSSCMAPIMQPPLIQLEEGGEPEIGFDGGYRNIFPVPAAEVAKARAAGKRVVIHAIGCTPLKRIHRVSSADMDDPLEMGLRSIEIFEAEVYDGDILQMREAVGLDGEIHLWTPRVLTQGEAAAELEELEGTGLTPIEIPGESFDASRNTIQGRLREGKRMVERGPLVLTGLDPR